MTTAMSVKIRRPRPPKQEPPDPHLVYNPMDLREKGIISPPEYGTDPYKYLLLKSSSHERHRLLLGIPVTGLVRIEWALGRWGQIIPTNWSMSDQLYALRGGGYPLGYDVKDARNVLVQQAILGNFEWLLFNDHDTIMPPDTFCKFNHYMQDGTIPLVSGLYFTKSFPAEPLVYRGRGNSYFRKWQLGDKFWVDGCGMGCMLLSVKVLHEMWKDAPEYVAGGNQTVRQVFDTPQFEWRDPETGIGKAFMGTEDLAFFDRMREGEYLAKAGFKKVGKQKYFVLMDSSIFCKHITPDGMQYPLQLQW
jgi:hypothetical protein